MSTSKHQEIPEDSPVWLVAYGSVILAAVCSFGYFFHSWYAADFGPLLVLPRVQWALGIGFVIVLLGFLATLGLGRLIYGRSAGS